MVTSVSDYHAPILPLKKPYFTGSQGIERVKYSIFQLLKKYWEISALGPAHNKQIDAKKTARCRRVLVVTELVVSGSSFSRKKGNLFYFFFF